MDTVKFTHPGITERRKGQRHAPRVLPMFAFERDGRLVSQGVDHGAVRVAGSFQGYDPVTGGEVTYDALEVTLLDGTAVACYRLRSNNGRYAVCQWDRYTAGLPAD